MIVDQLFECYLGLETLEVKSNMYVHLNGFQAGVIKTSIGVEQACSFDKLTQAS